MVILVTLVGAQQPSEQVDPHNHLYQLELLLSPTPRRRPSYIQLGQLSVIPPGLVLEAGGDFNLAGSYACKVEVPPHFKVPSGGDFSSPGMAAC